MPDSPDAIDTLWKRCGSMSTDLEEGLWTMVPRDWENLSQELDEALGEMEILSPNRRQQFETAFGR